VWVGAIVPPCCLYDSLCCRAYRNVAMPYRDMKKKMWVPGEGGSGSTYIREAVLRVPHRAGTVGARKFSKYLGLGSSLRLRSRAPTTRGQARWSTYIRAAVGIGSWRRSFLIQSNPSASPRLRTLHPGHCFILSDNLSQENATYNLAP
jgi:hypothetical protein